MLNRVLLFSFLFCFACVPKVEPVIFGAEACDFCAMKIQDHRFGGVLLTEKGKTYKFDSVECLMKFESEKLDREEKVKERYVFNTFKKGEYIVLERATYLDIPGTRSPMGRGVWAADSAEPFEKAKAEHTGAVVLSWPQLKTLLLQK